MTRSIRWTLVAAVLLTACSSESGSAPVTRPSAAQSSAARDGGWIVFSRVGPIVLQPDVGTADVVIMDPDGTGARVVSLTPPVEGGGGAFWSPDGFRLLITNLLRLGGARGFKPFRPATVSPDGSNLHMLDVPNGPFNMFCEAWSPDGTRIACGFGGGRPGVFTIDATDGSDPLRLSTNPYGARGADYPGDYSPDGSRVVFVRVKPGHAPNVDNTMRAAVYVVNADGSGRPRQVTPFGSVNPHDFAAIAHWSPDGQDIIYASPPSTHGLIHIVRADGTDLRTIDPGGFPLAPNWSPDGKKIVFTRYVGEDQEIFTANADGSDMVQITDTPGLKNMADWGP